MKRIVVISALCLLAASDVLAQKADRTPWDINITPKVGANYSTFTGVDDGEGKIGFVGGVSFEVVLTKKLSFDTEISFSHEGCHNYTNPATERANDARLNFLNMDYTLRYYPFERGTFNIFAGLHAAYLAYAKVNYQDYHDEFISGDIGIPLGIGYEFKNLTIDAKYVFSFRKLGDSERAKRNLGDARMMAVFVTLGYKIHLF